MAEVAIGSSDSQTCVSTPSRGCVTSVPPLGGAGHGGKDGQWSCPGLNSALGAGEEGGWKQGDKQFCDWMGYRLMFPSEAGIKEQTSLRQPLRGVTWCSCGPSTIIHTMVP